MSFVSRAGQKLDHALTMVNLDVTGRTCADLGSNVGGFVDCLIQRAAAKVYAVDTGYGTLDWKLRNDPRVVVLEKTNIRYLEPARLPFIPALATIDASFISLKLILPKVHSLVASEGTVVALIKPQFEVGKGKVGKGGVVRSAEEHNRVIDEISRAAVHCGFRVLAVTESPLLGPKGNKEFLLHLTMNSG